MIVSSPVVRWRVSGHSPGVNVQYRLSRQRSMPSVLRRPLDHAATRPRTLTAMSSHYVPHTKIPTLVFPTSTPGVAARGADDREPDPPEQLRRPAHRARPATGSTPVGLYRELIRLHKEAGLDFSRVVTFNLDEYYPMTPDDAAQLPPLDAGDVLQPRQHPAAEHPHPRRHDRRRRRSRNTARATSSRSAGPAASTCRSWASAAPGTSASTSPARPATAAPAWSRSTR